MRLYFLDIINLKINGNLRGAPTEFHFRKKQLTHKVTIQVGICEIIRCDLLYKEEKNNLKAALMHKIKNKNILWEKIASETDLE